VALESSGNPIHHRPSVLCQDGTTPGPYLKRFEPETELFAPELLEICSVYDKGCIFDLGGTTFLPPQAERSTVQSPSYSCCRGRSFPVTFSPSFPCPTCHTLLAPSRQVTLYDPNNLPTFYEMIEMLELHSTYKRHEILMKTNIVSALCFMKNINVYIGNSVFPERADLLTMVRLCFGGPLDLSV